MLTIDPSSEERADGYFDLGGAEVEGRPKPGPEQASRGSVAGRVRQAG